MDLMDLHRSTLQHGGVSGGAGLTLEEVTNDLKNLDWQECHVTSLVTVGAIVPATSVSSEGGTAPVKRESAKERHVTSDLVNEHAIVPAASASTVSVKRKTKKKHQVTSLTTEGAIIPAGGGCTVPVKLKKAKERLESSLRTEDAVVPAVASSEGGTVPAKRKKAKARLVSSLVTEGAAVPAVSTSSEGGGTVAAKRKRPKGLGMKATKAAGVDHSVVSAGTTVAAGSTTERWGLWILVPLELLFY